MKKLFIIPLLISFVLLPFKAFASVDITLEDKSTTEQKSVGIMVDTGTDVLDSISFKIQASTDVTVSQVIDQNSTCENLTYVNESNVITVTCTMEEAKVISAYVGTIIFTSTGNDYTFTILKSDGLDIGTLTLGTVTDIEAETVQTEEQTTTPPITTAPTTTSTTTSSITKYLPYILIGGATILLISIIGILFSKKKTPETPQIGESTSTPEVPTEPVVEQVPEPVKEELYTPPVQPQEPVMEPQPTIQEKLEQPLETPTMPADQSVLEPTTPAQTEQSSDLSALINAEQQTPAPIETPPVMTAEQPVVEPVQEPVVQPQEEQTTTPMETPTMSVEETPTMQETSSQPLPDLQQLVNTQTQEEGIPVPPSEESVPQPTEEVPPVQQAM